MSGSADPDALPLHCALVANDATDRSDIARLEGVTEDVTRHFTAYRDGLYRYLVHAEHAPAPEAEDITQEAFLALHNALLDGKEIRSVTAWLYTVARHLASKRRRRRRYELPMFAAFSASLVDSIPDGTPSSEEALHRRQCQAALQRAKATLTPLQCRCLNLRAEGLSLEEIGQVSGISPKRASEAARRAIRNLQRHFHGLF